MFMVIGGDNPEDFTHLNAVCYSPFTYCRRPVEHLTVYHTDPSKDEALFFSVWSEYVTSHPIFGRGFLTKSYDEGIKEGWSFDMSQPRNITKIGLTCLRMPWENSSFASTVRKLLEYGFTVEQAHFIANNWTLYKGELVKNNFNSNHIAPPKFLEWERWNEEHLKIDKHTYQDSVPSEHRLLGVTKSWKFSYEVPDFYYQQSLVDCPNYWAQEFTDKFVNVKFTDKTAEYLHNQLKEKK